MRALHQIATVATSGLLVSVCTLASGWAREWTSKAGTTINAQLVRVHLDNVILKKDDGRELVVPIAKLSEADQRYLQAAAKKPAASAVASTLVKELGGTLAKVERGKVKRAELEDPGAIKFLAVYYSAHWCGPCRSFTPDLVDFYARLKPEHPDFEVVFVTSDRSEEEWETYMVEADMPWYAVQFDKAPKSKLKAFGGPGIPCLVVLSPTGEILSDSYANGEYVGPRKVLADLEEMLAAQEPAAAGTPPLETLGSLKP